MLVFYVMLVHYQTPSKAPQGSSCNVLSSPGHAGRAEELENFHGVLTDISWGRMTERVKAFVIEAYVRGAEVGCAERAELEGSTSVFTKRRYRDRWNRTIVRRIAKVHNHTLKIKGRCRARGARGKDWFNERRTQYARRKSRSR